MPLWKVRTLGAATFAALIIAGSVFLFRPEWIVASLSNRSPDVVYRAETDELVVALTIDDGPDPVTSPRILDVLQQHNARATFFLITSRIPGNEDIVNRTVQENHELGNHLTTDTPSILLDASEFEQRLSESHRVLSRFATVRWFRPGSGWYSSGMLSILERHGYRCALGSLYPFDPQIPSAWFAERYVLHNVRPGSIIVLHDHGARGERTADTLAKLLPELNRRGFRVVTLSELVED